MHLATREPHAAGSQHGLIAVRRLVPNEAVGKCHFGRPNHVVGIGAWRAVTDVVLDRVVEQNGPLRYQCDPFAQIAHSHFR